MAQMKNNLIKFLSIVVALLFAKGVEAADITVDNISYNVVSFTEFTCEVTGQASKYTGDIVIPDTISYNGKKLAVEGIGNGAFASCDKLKTVKMPATVTYIRERGCYLS